MPRIVEKEDLGDEVKVTYSCGCTKLVRKGDIESYGEVVAFFHRHIDETEREKRRTEKRKRAKAAGTAKVYGVR